MIRIEMDMPEKCLKCQFRDADYTECHATKDNKLIMNVFSRPEWCPLHPIEIFGDGVCTKSPSGEEERFTLYRDSLAERKEEQP